MFYLCSHFKKKNKQGILMVNTSLMICDLLVPDCDHTVHS